VHPLAQLRSNFIELGCHALADRFPVDREFACPVVRPTDVGETQKVKGFRLPFSPPLPTLSGKAPELNQARFLRVQFQPEFRQPFPQLLQELLRVLPALEPQHGIVRVAHDDHITTRPLLPPCVHPQIQGVVKVEIGKDW